MTRQTSIIDEIKRFTVGIDSLGTGVIVTADGLIVTCYHVIEKLDHKVFVRIYFPSSKVSSHARVVDKYCNSDLDIAFLQLNDRLPIEATVANLSEKIVEGHKFKSFGFRKQQIFDGLYSPCGDATIEGKVRKK